MRGGTVMSDNQINTKDFLIGTLIGTMVGAAVALVFAPKSGRELRRDINQGAYQAKDYASNWKNTAQEKGAEWKDIALVKGSEFKQKAVDSTTELAKNVAQRTQDLTKTVQNKFGQSEEDGDLEEDFSAPEENEPSKAEPVKAE